MYEEKNIKESPFAGMAGFGGGSTGISLVKTALGPGGGWITRYHDSYPYWEASGISVSSDGIFITGRSNGQINASGVKSPYSGVFMRMSTDGTAIDWINNTVIYDGGTYYNHLMSANSAFLSNGNIVVAGYTSDANNDDSHVLYEINKTNGAIVSRKVFATEQYSSAKQVRVDSSDNIYVTGYYGQAVTGNYGVTLYFKFNSSYVLQWSKYYGSLTAGFTGSTTYNNIDWHDIDSSGNLYAYGWHMLNQSTNQSHRPTVVAKFDTNGNEVWKRQLNWSSSEMSRKHSIKVTDDGKIYALLYAPDSTGASNTLQYVIVILNASDGSNQTYVRTTMKQNHSITIQGFQINKSTKDIWIFGNDSSTPRKLYVYKLDVNFTLQWAFSIAVDASVTTNSYGFQPHINGHFLDASDTLYLSCVTYNDKNYVVKIPTGGLTAGTFGDYTVTNVSSTWGVNQAPGFPTNSASTLAGPSSFSNNFLTKTFQNHTPTVTLDNNQEI